MLSLDEAKEDLSHLLARVENLHFERIVLGSKVDAEAPFVTEFDAPDSLHERLLTGPVKALKKRSALNADDLLEVRAYQPGNPVQSQQVYVFDPEEDPAVKALLEKVRLPSRAISAFDLDDIPWNDIHFEARIVRCGTEKAAFLRKTTSSNILARSKKMRLIVRDGSLEKADSPIVLLDDDVDGVYWRKKLYIFRPGPIEMLLGFEQELTVAVDIMVQTLCKQVPIAGFEKLAEAAARHWQMARKLQGVMKKDYITSITVADVRRVAEKVPGIAIGFSVVAGVEQVVYETSDKWALLRILDDDYVKGELTNRLYESGAKSELA